MNKIMPRRIKVFTNDGGIHIMKVATLNMLMLAATNGKKEAQAKIRKIAKTEYIQEHAPEVPTVTQRIAEVNNRTDLTAQKKFYEIQKIMK